MCIPRYVYIYIYIEREIDIGISACTVHTHPVAYSHEVEMLLPVR